jgi:hypothetical protein
MALAANPDVDPLRHLLGYFILPKSVSKGIVDQTIMTVLGNIVALVVIFN